MTKNAQFAPARQKLCIASLDEPKIRIDAQYNPKDLKIQRDITWEDGRQGANRADRRLPHSPEHNDLDFKGGSQRTMNIELLFDGYETGRSIEPAVATLETLATVYNPEALCDHERRPHHCLVGWGGGQEAMPSFRCVINSLTTTYTMWNTQGRPLRATCTVSFKEAHHLSPWFSNRPRDTPRDAAERRRWQDAESRRQDAETTERKQRLQNEERKYEEKEEIERLQKKKAAGWK